MVQSRREMKASLSYAVENGASTPHIWHLSASQTCKSLCTCRYVNYFRSSRKTRSVSQKSNKNKGGDPAARSRTATLYIAPRIDKRLLKLRLNPPCKLLIQIAQRELHQKFTRMVWRAVCARSRDVFSERFHWSKCIIVLLNPMSCNSAQSKIIEPCSLLRERFSLEKGSLSQTIELQ